LAVYVKYKAWSQHS